MPVIDYAKKAERSRKRALTRKDVSQKNKDDLLKFLNSREISKASEFMLCDHLTRLFQECDDIVGCMQDRDKVNAIFTRLRKSVGSCHLETIKSKGKTFVRWFNDGDTPKGWRDIKSSSKKQKRDLNPNDMLTWEDAKKMIDETNSIQLKAIIMTQLDGGFRPSEIIDLKYGDISKEGKYIIAHVNGKTGKRDVFLWRSVPFIQRWIDNHPMKQKDSPMWVIENPTNRVNKKGSLKYDYYALAKRIRFLANKCNIGKPVDFYNFRHSSAVLKKLENIPIDVAAANMGHSIKHFTETYGRLSIKDISNRFDKAYGMAQEEDNSKDNPIECRICKTINDAGSEYCEKCNNPLTFEVARRDSESTKEMKNELDMLKEQMEQVLKSYALKIGK